MSSSRCFFDIVDIAMLTISCRYHVNIGTLSYLVNIFDIAMLTISCLYRVNIGTLSSVACHTSFTSLTSSTSRCWRYCIDIVQTSVPYHTSFTWFTSSTSQCWRFRIDIMSTSVPCHHLPVIPRLHHSHRWHRDVDDIVSTSCRHRYPVIICLSYLVYIVNIVDIAMLTISCRYRVDIVTLSYFVNIVYIIDDVNTISCIHGSHRDVDDVNRIVHRCKRCWHDIIYTSFTSRCRRYRNNIVNWTWLLGFFPPGNLIKMRLDISVSLRFVVPTVILCVYFSVCEVICSKSFQPQDTILYTKKWRLHLWILGSKRHISSTFRCSVIIINLETLYKYL